MKKIILATLAAAALVACAKEDVVVAPKGEAIAFDNAFVDNTTKAIDPSITNTSLKGFLVYGTTKGDHAADAKVVNIYNGVEVLNKNYKGDYNVGTDWAYASQYTQYWIDGNYYTFAAVANGLRNDFTGTLDATKVKVDDNGMPKSINYDVADQYDLLYASNAEARYTKGTSAKSVGFTFNHLLSKAVFTFKNDTKAEPNTEYYYKVENITIEGVAKSANYIVAEKKWGANTTSSLANLTTLEFGNIVADNAAAGTEAQRVDEQGKYSSNYERLLIPGKYNVTIKCTINLYYKNDDNLVDVINYSKPLTFEFQNGYSYSFNLSTKLEDVITFTVDAVNGWTEKQVDKL